MRTGVKMGIASVPASFWVEKIRHLAQTILEVMLALRELPAIDSAAAPGSIFWACSRS